MKTCRVGVSVFALTMTLAGCGTTAAAPPSHSTPLTATSVVLHRHLKNTRWYPPAVVKHYATTGVAYRIPNTVGLESWSGNPTQALLTTLNHLRTATSPLQVMEYSDPSFWPSIHSQWQFPNPHSRWYHVNTASLTLQNIQAIPAGQSPYAGVIHHTYGTPVLTYSWAVAVGEPDHVFTTWYKTHPALTPWYYFVDVRGHWLLYAIEN
jgi:hypothetical protein